jgi:acylphosphatase
MGESRAGDPRERPDRQRKRVRVHGRVQGVWFRGSTQQRARELSLAGWVRNCADGSVEAVFEGSPDAVAAAIAFCREGPPAARVTSVDLDDEPWEGLDDFVQRR